jgi:hypothetical protein
VLLAMLLTLAASCTRDPAIEKTRLGRLPPLYRTGSIAISSDGWAYAVVATGSETDHVVSSLGVEPSHALALSITFVPKSHRFLYWVSPTRDDTKVYKLVVDGAVIATDAVLPGPLTFSEDGSRWAVTVLNPTETPGAVGSIALLSNGKELGSYDDATGPALSPDGRHVAYLGARDNVTRLYVDSEARQTFERPAEPCGASAVEAARHPDLPAHHAVRFLADGSLFVVTRDVDGWGIYRNGTRLASYPVSTFDSANEECRKMATLAIGSIRTAAEAPDAYWWERIAGDAELWRVVRNGQPVDDVICHEPWRRHPPEISADGNHVLYPCSVVKDGDENVKLAFVVKDGTRYGPYQDVWGPALSPNGLHGSWAAAGTAATRPWSVYVDGTPRIGRFEMIWRPRASDDGKAVAWEAKPHQEGRGYFGIDQRRIGSFDEILWGPEMEADDRVAWVIRRGSSLTRVSVPLLLGRQPHLTTAIVAKPAPSPSPAR